MKLEHTERGFELVTWLDHSSEHGRPAELQQSSAVDTTTPDGLTRPGSSYLWLGHPGQGQRLHLDRATVRELRDRLTAWLETGSLRLETDGEVTP